MSDASKPIDIDAFESRADAIIRAMDSKKRHRAAVVAADGINAAAAELLRLQENESRLRALHAPCGIYDTCDHQHTEPNEQAGIFDIPDVGITCVKMYDICRFCCMENGESQTEQCLDHNHGLGIPICKTIEIIGDRPRIPKWNEATIDRHEILHRIAREREDIADFLDAVGIRDTSILSVLDDARNVIVDDDAEIVRLQHAVRAIDA